jgi:hypothetical protein
MICALLQELIDHVVAVAENTADELARSDGREVQLEEDPDLQLPFLLPEDGYSCDVVRNVPNGFQEFLEPLVQRGGRPCCHGDASDGCHGDTALWPFRMCSPKLT